MSSTKRNTVGNVRMRSIIDYSSEPETPEEAARRAEAVRVKERMEMLVWLFCDAYAEGDLTLENLCRFSVKVTVPSKQYSDYIAGGLDRQKLLGSMLERAMGITVPKRKRGNRGLPQRLRSAVKGLVKLIQQNEGLSTNRASGASAIKKAMELLKSAGIHLSEDQIEAWTYPRKTSLPPSKSASVKKRKSTDAR